MKKYKSYFQFGNNDPIQLFESDIIELVVNKPNDVHGLKESHITFKDGDNRFSLFISTDEDIKQGKRIKKIKRIFNE